MYGIIPPTITPFHENGDIDELKLRLHIRRLLQAGVHGISFGGSTGEGALLADHELARGVQIIQEENHRGIPVLCGIIRNSTRDAIQAGLAAKAAGAHALMVTPVYYHGTTEAGNVQFFRELGGNVDLPIIIYNVIASNPIMPETMKLLMRIRHIAGIKQSVGGIHALTDMIAACGQDTLVFGAQDDLMYISYELGAIGAISAVLTLFPELCVEQWEALQRQDYAKAKEIHYRMLPVWRSIEGGVFPGRIKAALSMLGHDAGLPRQPMQPPGQEPLQNIRTALEQSGFIPHTIPAMQK